jgi:release factor glutamine methyltransferase
MTIREALASASSSIARRDADTLLADLLQSDRAYLFAHPEAELTPTQASAFTALTARRAAHEPLQHLTGQQEFFGLTLRVTADTLIPRPETELLVEAVLAWAADQPSPLRILDIGTGTGAIALALATHLPTATLTAVDISAEALGVARDNASALQLTHRIRFQPSDLLSALPPDARFDAIVSNPPYIPLADAPTLQPEVRDFEPTVALYAEADGLAIYRRLIPSARAALQPGGLLALEFGFGQREALRTLFEQNPGHWRDLRFLDDYAGIPRVALALRAAS